MGRIITKNSSTAGVTPSDLAKGELAINVADGKMFYGDGSTVQQFTGASGSTVDTSSLATTGSNTFKGNQTISGSADISGSVVIAQSVTASSATFTSSSIGYLSGSTIVTQVITASNARFTTASIDYLYVNLFESASTIYSSGSNQFGDAANDTQTLYGTVVIPTGSLTVSGSTIVRSSLGTGAAFQVLSGSSPILYAGTDVLRTRVGIRTSSPQYSFDVNGNANFTPEEHSGYLRISPGQSSTWNNPTFFQTSFGSTLILNNAYYTASGGQFIRATNGYAAGIQLEPSAGGIELFTAPYGTAGTAFSAFTSRISITNSGSVGINNTSPSYSLDVSGSGNYTNGLTITGSLLATSSFISKVDYIDFTPNKYDTVTPGTIPTQTEGRLFYDTGSQTLCMYNAEADVTLNIGQEQWLRARNQTGVTITNGSVVKISGAVGSRPSITLAQATDQTNVFTVDNDIIGMATHDIEHGTDGFITTFGLVNGVNTNNGIFAAGDLLWVSQSAGQYTKVPPPAPYDKTFIGVVTRANASNGTIFISPTQPLHFHDISSVSASGNYTQGDVWMYRASGSTGVWTNTKTLSGSYTITGSLTSTLGFTGSLQGTASWANNALTSSNILGGTTDYIPLWNTNTRLTSSYLKQFNLNTPPFSAGIITEYPGNSGGLYLDLQNKFYLLGNSTGVSYTYLVLDETSQYIRTNNNGSNKGLDLTFTDNTYAFGDLPNTQKITIDGNTEIINIADNASVGVKIEGSARIVTIGDVWGVSGTNTKVVVDATNNVVQVTGSFSVQNGAEFLSSITMVLGNYGDDTEAAANGVPLNGLYRNGNVVSIRVS